MNNQKSCSCEICQNACKRRPGWFAPGEVEKTAELLDISLEKLFKDYLVVDYWSPSKEIGNEENIYVLSPGVKGNPTGQEAAPNPLGECIFFKDGLCSIHDAKPNGCSFYMHDKDDGICKENQKENVILPWCEEENKQQIVDLLGREPYVSEIDIIEGALSIMIKMVKDGVGL